MNDALQQLLDRLTALLAEKPLIGAWYTTVVRFVFPLLALMILVGAIRSLWKVKHPDEVWGYLVLRNGAACPSPTGKTSSDAHPAAMCSWNIHRYRVSTPRSSARMTAVGRYTTSVPRRHQGNDLPVDEYALVEDGDTVTLRAFRYHGAHYR